MPENAAEVSKHRPSTVIRGTNSRDRATGAATQQGSRPRSEDPSAISDQSYIYIHRDHPPTPLAPPPTPPVRLTHPNMQRQSRLGCRIYRLLGGGLFEVAALEPEIAEEVPEAGGEEDPVVRGEEGAQRCGASHALAGADDVP